MERLWVLPFLELLLEKTVLCVTLRPSYSMSGSSFREKAMTKSASVAVRRAELKS